MATKTAAKTAPAAADEAAPQFTFGEAPVPTQTRTSTVVNPLLAVCEQIKETMGEDGKSTVAKTVASANEEQTKKIKRWLALAGKDLGVTFRSIVKDNVVTFWAVERIEHKNRKPRGSASAK